MFAGDERERKLDRIGDPLALLSARVDFAAITRRVKALLPVVDYAKGGRPPFSVLLMVKLLVLKQLYNLSDDQVEYQALDRVTFQRLLGLASSSRIPRAQKDLDARWTKKHGKSHFGYKAHVSADVRYKLARKHAVTDASVHDTHHFEDLLDPTNTSREVSADKGYVDGEREARLTAAGWRVKVQRKAKPGRPLGERQKARNTRIAKVRARVEHVFAGLYPMGGQIVRTIGQARAEFQIVTKFAVYNMKRLTSLNKCAIAAF